MKKVTYKDRYFVDAQPVVEIRTSKVYGEFYQRMPSGLCKMVKVWNTRTNSMNTIKAEMIVEVLA